MSHKKTLSIILGIFFILAGTSKIVYAHDIVEGDFLFINDIPAKYEENLDPKPDTIEGYSHILTTELLYPNTYSFFLDLHPFEEKYDGHDLSVVWSYENKEFRENPLEINFTESGSRILNFKVRNGENTVSSESFLLNIGENNLTPAKFKINEVLDAEKKIVIDGSDINLEIIEPKDEFEYLWDLGDGQTSTETNFNYTYKETTLFPLYIVLRSTHPETGYFSDSYIKVESSKDTFKINKPPVKVKKNNSNLAVVALSVAAIFVSGAIVFVIMKKRVSRK